MKLYSDFKEAGEAEDDAMMVEPRLLRRSDIPQFGDKFLKAEKEQEQKIEADYTDETTTTLLKCITPDLPPAPSKPKPSADDETDEERVYNHYMQVVLYNTFENPKG